MSITLDAPWGTPLIVQVHISGLVLLKFTGTYTGDASGGLEYRIRIAAGAPVVDWAALAGFADGKFAGSAFFNPSANNLTLEVRFTAVPATKTGEQPFGVGDVYLVTGQSLPELWIDQVASSPAKNCAMSVYVPNAAESSALGMGGTEGWSNSSIGDAAVTFANILTASRSRSVGYVFLAKGGTPLIRENASLSFPMQYLLSMEGDPANNYTEGMLHKALLSLRFIGSAQYQGPDFAGIIHIHGEADTANSNSYYRGLTQYYGALRNMTHRAPEQCPFFIGPVGKSGTDNKRLMRHAMIQWARQTRGAVLVADRYDSPRSDTVHWTAAGAVTWSRRLGMDVLFNDGAVAVKGNGPRLVTGRRVTTTITLPVNLNTHAGIAAVDGARPLTGFTASPNIDMSSPLTISNAVVSSGNIVLTLSADPGADVPVYVEFQPTSATGTDATDDNNVYSTNLATGDAKGLPLQPTSAAIIVR